MAFQATTLGCKVNQYESRAIAEALVSAGLTRAKRGGEDIDLVVINTCCVTATAMAKSRQAIARAVRRAPEAAVLVVGCYGDYDPGRIRGLLGAVGVPPQRVFLAGHSDDLSACLGQVLAEIASLGGDSPATDGGRDQRGSVGGNRRVASPATPACCPASEAPIITPRSGAKIKHKLSATAALAGITSFPGRQRAIVKVQDGCDAFCAYCIVPHVRRRLWSRPAEDIERECRALVAAGHREIVLCGVHLGAYGCDTTVRLRRGAGRGALAGLVRRIAAIDGLWRVRLSSLDCLDADDELLAACRELPDLAPHFHLPLQSGSDRVLRRMNRQYTAAQFAQAVARVREATDRPAITTDIIVGFPGEEDGDFAATLAAARAAGFAKIHAFPFSAIKGTAAWAWRAEAPPRDVVKDRMAALAELEAELAVAYRRQFLGQTLQALVEGRASRRRPPGWLARTDRYFTVRLPADGFRPGCVASVRIDRADPHETTASPAGRG